MDIEYTKNFIKGKIAEHIFELMFRESGKFTVLKFGYENTLQELAQYQHLIHVKSVLDNIRNAPDFVLVSQDKREVYLVEVKYRKTRNPEELKKIAEENLKTWNPSWLFIASPDGFFFEPCNSVLVKNGEMDRLYSKWVSEENQEKFNALTKIFLK